MPLSFRLPCWSVSLGLGLAGAMVLSSTGAIAQIQPDATLGNERSVVTPNVTERGMQVDRIDGGALRGSNLFHSFSDFHVNQGQRVYFADPASVDNIIGRITGQNRSDINGLLGVLGNANLFLINPNGIVFGPNAQLDVSGAFFASTARSLSLGNGLEFSAINPEAPPLVVVNIRPGLQYGAIPDGVAIANSGTLQTGGDLTLAADMLNLQGQLRAGSDLSLLAADSITIRDTAISPFIASTGDQLLMQGDRLVDIAILNHPDSALISGGDLVLRSANPVNTDAHFWSGGSFRTEQLDGQPGGMRSFYDPIVRARGDVSFAGYTGASLHIFAGGSVTADSITITGPDATTGLVETVTLSDGSSVAVNGRSRPTLDIRAGTTAFSPPRTSGDSSGFTPSAPSSDRPRTNANISIGTITNPTGLVLLTNQYQPNPNLSGNITLGDVFTESPSGGGSVFVDSRGSLSFRYIDVSGYDATFTVSGESGQVTLLADGEIRIPYVIQPLLPAIYAWGLSGGAITLDSNTAIVIEEPRPELVEALPPDIPTTYTTLSSATFDGTGNPIRFTAPSIFVGGDVFSDLYGTGRGGNIIVRADRDLRLSESFIRSSTIAAAEGNAGNVIVNATALSMDVSSIGSVGSSVTGGNTGTVRVTANTINGTNGSQIGTTIQPFQPAPNEPVFPGIGNARDVIVNAQEIVFSGVGSGIVSAAQSETQGNSGNVTVTTDTLSLQDGAVVFTSMLGRGNAGTINLRANRTLLIDGVAIADVDGDGIDPVTDTFPSGIGSELLAGATGQGGNITIETPILQVTNGGTISTSTEGNGPAGNITITATRSASFDGLGFDGPENEDRRSSARVQTIGQRSGNGGTLTINTPSLSITNGAQLLATTEGSGNSGDIVLNIDDTLTVDGTDSAILADTVNRPSNGTIATGNGGNILIDPDLVTISNGGRIAVNSQGTGEAGIIRLQAGSLVLDRGLISAETVSNTGGDIFLTIADVIAMQNNSRISTTAGTAGAGGDGGNITINTRYLVATPDENNDITANAFTGRGGRVSITADGIFGLVPRSRAELENLLGTTDPALLDPTFLTTSDITAISQTNPNLNGDVIIQTPDTDPIRGVTTLPANLVDASRLVAQGCAAGNTIVDRRGSLIVTGRGGLPPSPTDPLREDNVLIGWETLPASSTSAGDASLEGAIAPPPTSPSPIIEAQSLTPNAEGRMSLVAHIPGSTVQPFWNLPEGCTP